MWDSDSQWFAGCECITSDDSTTAGRHLHLVVGGLVSGQPADLSLSLDRSNHNEAWDLCQVATNTSAACDCSRRCEAKALKQTLPGSTCASVVDVGDF